MPPLVLDIGNVEHIENPSEEEVRHFLRFMPPAAPFVILQAAEDSFIQAAPRDDRYRVEYREGRRQYFTHVPFDEAARLFEAFRTGDPSFKDTAAWRRLTVLNDPHRLEVRLAVMVVVIWGGVALAVWRALR